MLLAQPEKYSDAFNAINKDIAYMPMRLKKTWGRKYYLWMNRKYYSRKLTKRV